MSKHFNVFSVAITKTAFVAQKILTFLFINPLVQLKFSFHDFFIATTDLLRMIKNKNEALLSAIKNTPQNNPSTSIYFLKLQQADPRDLCHILNSYIYASWFILLMWFFLLFIEIVITGFLWHILILLILFTMAFTYCSCCHRIWMIKKKMIIPFKIFINLFLSRPKNLFYFPMRYRKQ